MTRGLMNTLSRTALVAAAGMLMGAYAYAPAKAADLGGGCCADLEERVAELEATTARKGNRVVSLQVYGQVNKALMIWDDGVKSDAYVVDNHVSDSRFGFIGKATIRPGWTAGYNMEWELSDARSDFVENVGKNGDDTATTGAFDGALVLRQNNVYVESERLGRLTLGQASVATDGAFEVNLSNAGRTADLNWGNNFIIQNTGAAGSTTTRLKTWASDLDPGRNDIVRYDSPSIYGFILSAAWGDNDYADVAVRFKKEFNSIRIVAAVGYAWSDEATTDNDDFEEFGGSVSVMHVPTGLYVAFAAGEKEYKNTPTQTHADANYWYAQAGIEKKFMPYGATTVYGEYGQYNDFNALQAEDAGLGIGTSSEATRWGLGVNQKIDAAAMDVYAHATFWSFEDNFAGSNYEDLTTVVIGSRIKF